MKSPLSFYKRPVFAGLFVFTAVLILTQWMAVQRYLILKNNEERELFNHASWTKERLQTVFSHSLSTTSTLAFIVNRYGVPRDFDQVGRELMKLNPYIDAVQLTEGGKITEVYPLKGNEAAIGVDILKDSLRRSGALTAIKTKEFFVAGPIHLIQGGEGIVARMPIFKNDKFWGFSAVIIHLNTLFKAAGIDTTVYRQFSYQLAKVNSSTGEEDFFLNQSPSIIKKFFVPVELSNGEWRLYVVPEHSTTFFAVAIFALLGLILSITAGLFAWFIASQPAKLNKLVDEKTKEIQRSEHLFRSTLARVSDGFISLDKNFRYTYVNEKILEITRRDSKSLIGQKVWDMFPEAVGSATYKAFNEAMETQKNITHVDYFEPLDLWQENDIYPSPDGLTVFIKDITEAVKAQRQISLEKNLSESVINSLPGVFYLYNEEGRFLRWNKNFEKVTGYSAEEVAAMHPLDLFEGAEKQLLADKIKEVFATGNAEVEADFTSKKGKKIPYYFNGWTIQYENQTCLIGVGIDITKRKKAEEITLQKMAEINERVKELNCLYKVSEIAQKPGYSINDILSAVVYIIPQAYQFPEIACARITYREKMVESHGFQVSPWKQQTDIILNGTVCGKLEVCYKEERAGAFEGPFLKEERELIDSVAKILSSSIIRKIAEAELKASESRLADAQRVAKVGSWETDLSNLSVIWSDETYRIFGLDRTDFQNSHPVFLEYVHPQDRAAVDAAFVASFNDNEIHKIEHRIITGDKKEKVVEERWRIYRDAEGKPVKAVGTCQDITEQHKARQELKKTYDDIRRLNNYLQTVREEERTTIAREIHDELGQLLTGIKMDVSWLSKKIQAADESIKAKTAEVINLIDTTVKTVRRISSDLRPGILDDLGLIAALEWQTTEFEKRSGITCTFQTSLAELNISKDLATGVFRVYQESLTNIMRHAEAREVTAMLEQSGDFLQLTIRDNGIGFDWQDTQDKNTLGIIGMKERAAMMSGTLTVLSKKGEGASVVLKVPFTKT